MNASLPAQEADANNEVVKWQTAFWALVPLAMGAAYQPCGRVLDFPVRFSFWLRISPIICIADSVQWLFFLLLDMAAERSKDFNIVTCHLRHRFRRHDEWPRAHDKEEVGLTALDVENVSGSPPPDQDSRRLGDVADAGPQDLNGDMELGHEVARGAITRWALLCLSGIPCQTIKLVAMRGIPWTKTWALMYFISIIIGEAQYFGACRVKSAHYSAQLKWPRVLRSLRVYHDIFMILSMLVHAGLVSYCLHACIARICQDHWEFIWGFLVVASICGFYIYGALGNTGIALKGDCRSSNGIFFVWGAGAWVGGAISALYSLSRLLWEQELQQACRDWPMAILVPVLSLAGAIWAFLIVGLCILETISLWSPFLYLGFQEQALFYWTAIVAIFSYWLLYDPVHTANPTWLWIFG